MEMQNKVLNFTSLIKLGVVIYNFKSQELYLELKSEVGSQMLEI